VQGAGEEPEHRGWADVGTVTIMSRVTTDFLSRHSGSNPYCTLVLSLPEYGTINNGLGVTADYSTA
jgi:hypothetical protein